MNTQIDLRRWIHERHAPNVLVLSSERANEIARKNGLDFAELLSPFGRIDNQLSFRTPTQAYGLKDFKLEFVSAEELEPVPLELAESALQQVLHSKPLSKSFEDYVRDGPEDHQDLARFVKSAVRDKQDWYSAYRKCLERSLQHNETRLFGQPAGCLLVLSTADGNYLQNFEQLHSPTFLPSGFHSGQYDPDMPRFYVLVHDRSDPACQSVDVEAACQSCRGALRPDSFFFVDLQNDFDAASGVDTQAKVNQQRAHAAKWERAGGGGGFFSSRARRPSSPLPGCNLTDADMASLERFASSLLVSGILPAIESRLFALNTRVTEKRKGFRNVVKSWWRPIGSDKKQQDGLADGGAGGAEGSGDVASFGGGSAGGTAKKARFLHDSIESNIRLLADLAFMMQDYELAQKSYRIARDDFASSKALLHHGATLEMMALSSFMKGGMSQKVLDYLVQAQSSFREALGQARALSGKAERSVALPHAARMLTNSTMFFVDFLLVHDQGSTPKLFREATEMLSVASLDETSLAAAVLLEQTGLFLLYQELSATGAWTFENVRSEGKAPHLEGCGTVVTRLRKFGFHTVMASRCFIDSGNLEHALRCLATVQKLYDARWYFCADHVDLKIAENCAKLNDVQHALPYWTKILRRARKSPAKQAEILDQIQTLLGNIAADDPLADKDWDFSIPIVQDTGIVVQAQLNASVAPPLQDVTNPSILVEPESTSARAQGPQRQQEEDPLRLKEAQKVTWSAAKASEENAWKSLKTFLDGCSGTGKSEPSVFRRRGEKVPAVPDTCFVGEPLFVDVPLENPCDVKIFLKDLALEATLSPKEGQDIPPQALELPVVQQLLLAPQEKRVVRLSVTPKGAGYLRIEGIRWKLLGTGKMFRRFDIPGKRVNDTQEERAARAREPDLRLQRTIEPSSAWLGAELELPGSAVQGELMSASLDLINLGTVHVVGGVMAVCNLPCLCVGADENPVIEKSARLLDESGSAVELPIQNLEPGLPVSVPLCIRIPLDVAGLFKLRLLLKYNDGRVTRYVRLSTSIRVRASVAIRAKTFPLREADNFILSLSVQNMSLRNQRFRVTKLSGFSKSWGVHSISATSNAWIPPKGATTTLLMVQARGPGFGVADGYMGQENEIASSIDLAAEDDRTAGPESQARESAGSQISPACRKHFLCLENARRVLNSRKAFRKKYERLKDVLQEGGQLPVSIQEIRRLRRAGSDAGDSSWQYLQSLEKQSLPLEGEPTPTDLASLCWGDRGSKLHLIVEWEGDSHAEDTAEAPSPHPSTPPVLPCVGQSEVLEISVLPVNPLILDVNFISRPSPRACVAVPISLLLRNASKHVVSNAVFYVGSGQGYSWMGLTRLRLPDLAPNETHELVVKAVFHASGRFDLGGFKVGIPDKHKEVVEHSFANTCSMVVNDVRDPFGSQQHVDGDQDAKLAHEATPFPADDGSSNFMWNEQSNGPTQAVVESRPGIEPIQMPQTENASANIDAIETNVKEATLNIPENTVPPPPPMSPPPGPLDSPITPSSPETALSRQSSSVLDSAIRDLLGDEILSDGGVVSNLEDTDDEAYLAEIDKELAQD